MKTQLFSWQNRFTSRENVRFQTLKIILLFILLFVLTANYLFAAISEPDFPVKGIVVDSASGEGLSFVTIQIENNGEVVQRLASDNSGQFSFVLNTPGKYNVLFHSVGYQLNKMEITTSQTGDIDLGKIVLIPSSEQLGEVNISALKPLVRSEAEKLIYSVETDPEAKTSNVLEMLRKVPMVSVDGDDNVQLRGMSGVKFLIDGKSSVALDQNTREFLRNMPSNTIKDIEVITNPSSKYEAEGSAGIINIIRTRRVSDGYNGSVSAGLTTLGQYDGNVNFASKINKFIYSLNTVLNHYESPVSISESQRENFFSTSNRYTESIGSNKGFGNWYSLNSEASYEVDTLNLISVSFNGSLSEGGGPWFSTSNDFDLSHAATSGYEKKGIFSYDWKGFTGTFDYQKLFKRKGRIFTFSYRYDHGLQDANHNEKYVGLLNFPDYRLNINTAYPFGSS